MADFVFVRKSRNIASNMVHVFLNLLLGVGSVLITALSGSPIPGLILVLLSKWRVFAVRRRYIWLNVKSNLVDFIVGISVVLITYFAGAELLPVDFILMVFYSVWLIIIKPLSSENATITQSLISVFLGTSAAVFISANLNSLVATLLMFLIGYAASRHLLTQNNIKDFSLSSLVCGLVFAEMAWLSYTWSIIYAFGGTGIRIPQLTVILMVLSLFYVHVRKMMIRYRDDFRFRHIIWPTLLAVTLIGIVVIYFSNPIFNI